MGKQYRYRNPPVQANSFRLYSSNDGNGNVTLLTSGFSLTTAHDGNGDVAFYPSNGCSLYTILEDGIVTLGVN